MCIRSRTVTQRRPSLSVSLREVLLFTALLADAPSDRIVCSYAFEVDFARALHCQCAVETTIARLFFFTVFLAFYLLYNVHA